MLLIKFPPDASSIPTPHLKTRHYPSFKLIPKSFRSCPVAVEWGEAGEDGYSPGDTATRGPAAGLTATGQRRSAQPTAPQQR